MASSRKFTGTLYPRIRSACWTFLTSEAPVGDDPDVLPGVSREVLEKFPPTLLITGTRDFLMSSEIRSQSLLTQAGVEAELHVWNGMWHAFFVDPDMPESMQAYSVIAGFFARHLRP